MLRGRLAPLLVVGSAAALACGDDGAPPPAPAPVATEAPPAPSASVAPGPKLPTPSDAPPTGPLTGRALARLPGTEALILADEDHRALRLLPDAAALTGAADAANAERAAFSEMPLDGAPAQVVAWGDTVLVTLRDPGALVRYRVRGAQLVEIGRAPLPADAWGLAVDMQGKTAFVSSPWSGVVSVLDLPADGNPILRWSVDVPREPRGLAVTRDGKTLYVSHLVGSSLTVLPVDTGAAPPPVSLPFPASPLRAPSGKQLAASLGYALALSPEGDRLFAPRHALGALGREAWFGAATVDVLRLPERETLAPAHVGNATVYRSPLAREVETPDTKANLPADRLDPFVQPRDVQYRAATKTLLVVGEGDDVLVELDALGLDPTLGVLARHELARDRDPHLGFAGACGAPSAVELSGDGNTAYVLCRSTYDLAIVRLAPDPTRPPSAAEPPRLVRFADDPLGEEGFRGRRLFYDATDRLVSGGLACAGCHPEGRDDGFVWREALFDTPDGPHTNFVSSAEQIPDLARKKGVPRRTLMLAGRVAAAGPYGWRGESKTLPDRIGAGFGLHRWGGLPRHAPENVTARAGYLAVFLQRGLIPPPHPLAPREGGASRRELSKVEARGKEVFTSEAAGCATCHRPETGFTDRVSYPLEALPTRDGFDAEEKAAAFKTPSLQWVRGRAPLLHDASATSVADVFADHRDRMGKTSHLSEADLAALVAYVETL